MKLFEIQKEIDELIDYETGEIKDIEKFNQLQISEKTKKENWLKYIKNTESDILQLEEQEKAFKARKDRLKMALERSKEQFAYLTGYEPFECTTAKVSYRESEVTKYDEKLLPKKYYRIKREADLSTIKDLLKSGQKVRGAWLEKRKNMQIK